MNTIDIRDKDKTFPIERIVFAEDDGYHTPAFITKEDDELYFGNQEDEYLSSFSPEDGLNLLLALQKAQELGWIPKPAVAAKTAAKTTAAKKA